ncbi:MAG: leucine-rich repeat protein [Roseburia sp.]|nr:leucine-rich repeat protein [Roseburia sp.]
MNKNTEMSIKRINKVITLMAIVLLLICLAGLLIACNDEHQYIVTYNVNGGKLSDTEYTVNDDSSYTLAVPTREGYAFLGWYIDETQITDADGKSLSAWNYTENKTATAKWEENSYKVSVVVPELSYSTVTGGGYYKCGSEVTLTAAEPKLGYDFIGWYIGDELLSSELTYTFKMPATDITFLPYKVRSEMSNFRFESTSTTCKIIDVNDRSVKEIVIPEYVTSFGPYAFAECSKLESIIIPRNVSLIEGGAFRNCSSLTNITMTDSVKEIEMITFFGCTNLTTINYEGTLAEWCDISFGDECANPLFYAHDLYVQGELVTELIVPSRVKEISNYAFFGYAGITKVTLPYQLISIGEGAFQGCSNLTTVYWNAWSCGFKNSHYSVFKDCTNLTEVIMNGVATIPARAFYGCRQLKEITIPADVTWIGQSAFAECDSLTRINYLGTIADWCYIGFSSEDSNPLCYTHELYIDGHIVTDLIIPEGVRNIKPYAFCDCSSIKSVTMANSVKSIGSMAFKGCANLENITISDGITDIQGGAFEDCNAITSITIPKSIRAIGYQAFTKKNLAINYRGTIADWCQIDFTIGFAGGGYLYINDTLVTNIVIPDVVTEIRDYAFFGLYFSGIIIPKSVISIGEAIIAADTDLLIVYYVGTAEDWDKIVISNYNTALTNATRYYYSEIEPELNEDGTAYDGNYWHYNEDNEIVIWTK